MEVDLMRGTKGYKAILQAVLKTQIQILIEQLHDETGAESLFLMHSGKDGSLSHLGSYKGKRFLTEQNNIKSQFLGYFRNESSGKKGTKHRTPVRETEPVRKRQRIQGPEVGTDQEAQQQNRKSNIETMLQNSDHTGDTADAESNVADAELIAADSEPSDADRTDSVSRDNSVEKSLSQQMIKVENVEDEGLELTCVSVSENADHFNSDTEDESDNKNRGDQGQLGEGANVQADEMHETKNTVSEKMCAKNPETKDDAVKSEGISSTVQASLNTTSAKANISKSLVMEESVYSKSTTSVELHNSDKSCSEIDKEIGKDLNKRHLCYTCGRVFLSRNLLHRHSSSCNINPLTIPCPNCDEVFPQISQLRTHFSTHLDPVLAEHRLNEIRQATKKESFELKCDYVLSNGSVCNKMFAYQKNLERHMDTHFDRIRSHACKECPKKYYQKSHLDEHIDNCHSLSPPRYICPYCEKQFKGRKGLSSHKLRCTK